jgi:hypothetical protein
LQARYDWMQQQLSRAYQSLTASHFRDAWYMPASPIRPEGPLLAEYAGVDALAFSVLTVVRESQEAAAARRTENVGIFILGLLSGSTPSFRGSPERTTLSVVLLDGRTGDCLWRSWTEVEKVGGHGLEDAVKLLFKKYPHE